MLRVPQALHLDAIEQDLHESLLGASTELLVLHQKLQDLSIALADLRRLRVICPVCSSATVDQSS